MNMYLILLYKISTLRLKIQFSKIYNKILKKVYLSITVLRQKGADETLELRCTDDPN